MDYLVVLISLLFIPWIVGWLYGRNQIDPNTPAGRAYYIK
jgi:hypothetical protein